MAGSITFRPLTLRDLPRLRDWLNAPHVYEWWGVGSGVGSLGGPGEHAATDEQVHEKYAGPVDDPTATTLRHVIVVDARPIGLIQHSDLEAEGSYAIAIGETAPGAAAIDLLIGEPGMTGRGLGARVLDAYVTEVVFADPRIARAVAGPHPDNRRSCRAFEKAGFVAVRDVVVPGEGPERIYTRARGGATGAA
jgi:RimJ/RimL family protein N-acetyltransferase